MARASTLIPASMPAATSIAAGLLATEPIDVPEDITITAEYSSDIEPAQKQVSILAICSSGSALDFDGVDDYVVIPDSDSISLGNRDYTISAWINPRSLTGPGGAGTIVSKVKDGSDKEYRLLLIDGELYLDVEKNANNQFAETNTAFMEIGHWQYIAITFNSSTRH